MVQQHAARQRGTDFRHVGFLGPQPAVLWWSQLSGGIHVSIMILDSMSVLQAKHLSAQPAHGTTYVSVLEEALKNVFDCAKKGHFLCFAGFLERAAAAYFFFFWEAQGFWWRCALHVMNTFTADKNSVQRMPATTVFREIHTKSQENLPRQIFTLHRTNKQQITILPHSVTVFAQ